MPSVQIKDVPEDVLAVLRRRAANAHQSLPEYLRSRLIAEARRPTIDEALGPVARRSGGVLSLDTAARLLREDRDRR